MNAFNFNRVPCLALRGVGRPTIFDFLNIDPCADIFQSLRGFLCPGLGCVWCFPWYFLVFSLLFCCNVILVVHSCTGLAGAVVICRNMDVPRKKLSGVPQNNTSGVPRKKSSSESHEAESH